MFQNLQSRLDAVRSEYEKRRGRLEQLSEMKRRKEVQLAEVSREAEILEQVTRVFHASSEAARELARRKIERVVTEALRAVFGPGAAFEVEVSERRGRPEAGFYIASDFGGAFVRTPVLDARGGGVVDAVSLALRVLVAAATSPPRAPMVLDEPGKHLSEGYSRALGDLLRALAEETGRQFLIVTHDTRLVECGDAVYRVEMQMPCGESVVRKI